MVYFLLRIHNCPKRKGTRMTKSRKRRKKNFGLRETLILTAAVLITAGAVLGLGNKKNVYAAKEEERSKVQRIGPGGETLPEEANGTSTAPSVNIVQKEPLAIANETAVYTPEGKEPQELKGVWISYLEWEKMPKDEAGFKQAADHMLDNCVNWGLNAVFLHAHSHTDAMYPSEFLPWSKFASGVQGQNPGYDGFGYFVEAAHARGLQIHAWFNPYRVTGYHMSWEDVSPLSPVKQWLTDQTADNDRWVLKQEGEYYLNPALVQVREFVAAGVREVLQKYPVDGIHFDDYFYPDVNDSKEDLWFDRPEYLTSGSSLPIADWRRENVNQLISLVYQTVKSVRADAVFGISPQGYIGNLRSDTGMFVDIDYWLSADNMMDYIMPQLYWGFEVKNSLKQPASHAFASNLASWIELKNKGKVKLYLGLAMYRTGTNVSDNNEVSEWLRCNDIMKRQVEAGRQSGQVLGYCFFSYSSFLEETSQAELANLVPVLKQIP